MKPMNEDLEKHLENALNDGEQEKWERGELGNETQHTLKLSAEETAALHREKRKNNPTSIRLSRELIEELSRLAEDNGMPYQTYLRMVLTLHVKATKGNVHRA